MIPFALTLHLHILKMAFNFRVAYYTSREFQVSSALVLHCFITAHGESVAGAQDGFIACPNGGSEIRSQLQAVLTR